MRDAAVIANFKYPRKYSTILSLFDQSSCHRAYDEDALNARKVNICPDGTQPCMRDATWARKVQKVVDDNGIPKEGEEF